MDANLGKLEAIMADKILKTVALSDEQYEQMYIATETAKRVGKIIAAATVEAARLSARDEEHMWTTCERLLGLKRSDCSISLDWINRCVVAKEIDIKRDYLDQHE